MTKNSNYYQKNKEKVKEKVKKWRNTEKGKTLTNKANIAYQKTAKGKIALKKQYVKKIQTANGKARQIINHMKANSHKRGHEWSDEWWTIEKVAQIIETGRCCKTGLKFITLKPEPTRARNPFGASPDRLDNTKGYEPSNVQWVVFIYNLMRNNFKDEDVEVFIESLKTHSS